MTARWVSAAPSVRPTNDPISTPSRIDLILTGVEEPDGWRHPVLNPISNHACGMQPRLLSLTSVAEILDEGFHQVIRPRTDRLQFAKEKA